MNRYLLDTNAVIALLKDVNSSFAKHIRRHGPAEICLSSIVIHELYYGAFKSQRFESNIALVDNLRFEVLEFDREDARQAGEIRAILASEGKLIGPYDVLIAGQAKARDMVLITRNTKEFCRVRELMVEDWEDHHK